MPTLEIKIKPLDVPETVQVKIPGNDDPIDIPIEDLDSDTVTALLEEFSESFLKRAGIE